MKRYPHTYRRYKIGKDYPASKFEDQIRGVEYRPKDSWRATVLVRSLKLIRKRSGSKNFEYYSTILILYRVY